jgi:hypothetical protein
VTEISAGSGFDRAHATHLKHELHTRSDIELAGPDFTGTANGKLKNKDDGDTVSNITFISP